MDNNMRALSLDDPFNFSCSRDVPCFNDCCRDLNQHLTPYDILRLKNGLHLTSSAFLEKYTLQHDGPETGLPIISFKMDHASELKCPFVTKEGCRVYEDRPASCRTYPIARLVSRSRETEMITEYYILITEAHCRGFEQEKCQTVREWITSQGIAVYNEMNDMMMAIISLKNRMSAGPLDIKSRHLFYLALYNLDEFRTHVFEKGILDGSDFDSEMLEAARADDVALLKIGVQWVKEVLFV